MSKTVEIGMMPVGWNQKTGLPCKWQAVGIMKDAKGNAVRRIFGDPAGGETKAWENLFAECQDWEAAAKQVRAEMYRQGKA
jgi:hypothetical protein